MVDFKVDQTRLVTHVMHSGKCNNTFSKFHAIRWNIFRALTWTVHWHRVGAVLRILGGYKLIDAKALRGFLLTCQSEVLMLLLSTWSKFNICMLLRYYIIDLKFSPRGCYLCALCGNRTPNDALKIKAEPMLFEACHHWLTVPVTDSVGAHPLLEDKCNLLVTENS